MAGPETTKSHESTFPFNLLRSNSVTISFAWCRVACAINTPDEWNSSGNLTTQLHTKSIKISELEALVQCKKVVKPSRATTWCRYHTVIQCSSKFDHHLCCRGCSLNELNTCVSKWLEKISNPSKQTQILTAESVHYRSFHWAYLCLWFDYKLCWIATRSDQDMIAVELKKQYKILHNNIYMYTYIFKIR